MLRRKRRKKRKLKRKKRRKRKRRKKRKLKQLKKLRPKPIRKQKPKQLKRKQRLQNSAEIDNLLGDLTSTGPSREGGAASAGQGGGKRSGASNADVENYASKIKAAIQSKFYDSDTYRGRTCELKLQIAPDGLLVSITPKNNASNDPALCSAAIRAANLATLPRPPADVYEAFKNKEVQLYLAQNKISRSCLY